MEFKDLFLTPIYLIIFYVIAYNIRSSVTNNRTKKYFIPALTVKFFGAIALGLIYQFYYGGGDTFNYFNQSKIIYQAFFDSFSIGFKLLFSNGKLDIDLLNYSSRLYWYRAAAEFMVIKIATVFGLLSFQTYSVIALFFALFSFSGLWALYLTILKMYPGLYKQLAWAVFFIPTVFFWGSGLMKDTICIGAMGWLFWAFYKALIERKTIIKSFLIFLLNAWLINIIKKYILLAFLPGILFWLFLEYNKKIKNPLFRRLSLPFSLIAGIGIVYFAATNLTAGDKQYDIDKLAERTKITADYLYSVSIQQEGSAYKLGELDGTFGGMFKLAPKAINVSLFRPYLWEVKNPLMLLSAIESFLFLFFTFKLISKAGLLKVWGKITSAPFLLFCLIFTLVFAFAVGINSNNFGTLVRYKIPFIPFYAALLIILANQNSSRNRVKPNLEKAY
jgi:hypothetical protein